MRLLGKLFIILFASPVFAITYPTPLPGNDLIGQVQYITAKEGDTLLNIAEHHDVGIDQIIHANPNLDTTAQLSSGDKVKLPQKFIVPAKLERKGIIINLPEMRMYFYSNSHTVITYPVGIGRVGKTIPIERAAVARKVMNPSWTPPQDIREFNMQQGIKLPAVMPPGPDNPLGPYAIYLTIPTFLIHSTIFPESVGKRASFGCIRMHLADVKELYPEVQRGLPVYIIDVPTKVGWQGNRIYLESHVPLEESTSPAVHMNGVVQSIQNTFPKNRVNLVDWQRVNYLMKNPDGIPHEIGFAVLTAS